MAQIEKLIEIINNWDDDKSQLTIVKSIVDDPSVELNGVFETTDFGEGPPFFLAVKSFNYDVANIIFNSDKDIYLNYVEPYPNEKDPAFQIGMTALLYILFDARDRESETHNKATKLAKKIFNGDRDYNIKCVCSDHSSYIGVNNAYTFYFFYLGAGVKNETILEEKLFKQSGVPDIINSNNLDKKMPLIDDTYREAYNKIVRQISIIDYEHGRSNQKPYEGDKINEETFIRSRVKTFKMSKNIQPEVANALLNIGYKQEYPPIKDKYGQINDEFCYFPIVENDFPSNITEYLMDGMATGLTLINRINDVFHSLMVLKFGKDPNDQPYMLIDSFCSNRTENMRFGYIIMNDAKELCKELRIKTIYLQALDEAKNFYKHRKVNFSEFSQSVPEFVKTLVNRIKKIKTHLCITMLVLLPKVVV